MPVAWEVESEEAESPWQVSSQEPEQEAKLRVVIPPSAPSRPNQTQLAAQNNNPGNIEFNNQPGAEKNGRFAKFNSPEDGYREIHNRITRHIATGDTLGGYIQTYAPSNENNTEAYVRNAEAATGANRNTPLASVDRDRLAAFQAKQESGATVWEVAKEEPISTWEVEKEEPIQRVATTQTPPVVLGMELLGGTPPPIAPVPQPAGMTATPLHQHIVGSLGQFQAGAPETAPAPTRAELGEDPEVEKTVKRIWKNDYLRDALTPKTEEEKAAFDAALTPDQKVALAITRTAAGLISPETLAMILGGGEASTALKAAAEIPRVAVLLKASAPVAKAFDILASTGIPATFTGISLKGAGEEGKASWNAFKAGDTQASLEHGVNAATNLIFAGLGAVGIREGYKGSATAFRSEAQRIMQERADAEYAARAAAEKASAQPKQVSGEVQPPTAQPKPTPDIQEGEFEDVPSQPINKGDVVKSEGVTYTVKNVRDGNVDFTAENESGKFRGTLSEEHFHNLTQPQQTTGQWEVESEEPISASSTKEQVQPTPETAGAQQEVASSAQGPDKRVQQPATIPEAQGPLGGGRELPIQAGDRFGAPTGLQQPGAGMSDSNQPQPIAGDQGADLERPVRRITGSSNIPLSADGRAQIADLKKKAVEPFDWVISGPEDRNLETARAFGDPTVENAFRAWPRGEHEGRTAEEAKADIGDLMVNPDKRPPGISSSSGQPGLTFNEHHEPLLAEVKRLKDNAVLGESGIIFTSGGNMQAIDHAAKHNFDLGKIDRADMASKPYASVTGKLFELTDDGLKEVKDNSDHAPIYFAEHAATKWNPPPGAETKAPNKLSAPTVRQNIPRSETLDAATARLIAPGSTRVNPNGSVQKLTQVPLDKISAMTMRPQSIPEWVWNERGGKNVMYPERVAQYFKSPTPVAPELIQQSPESGKYEIWDGHHRVEAARQQGKTSILAWVPEGAKEAVQSERGQPTKQRGKTEQRRAVPESRRPSDSSRYGAATSVHVAGEQRSFEARYAVRESSDVVPSHNPFTFQENPDYQLRNDRNYTDHRNAGRILKQVAEFNHDYVLTESPTAGDGAPVIDKSGNVLGGNSRAMTIARVYAERPEAASAYKQELERKAQQFGLKPEDVASMKQPVLVRELTRELEPHEIQAAITDFNKSGTAALSSSERAIADSARISPETLDQLAGMIEAQGPTGTLAEALSGKGGTYIVDRLVKDGVITEQEKPALFDSKGVLTPAAKDRISKLMLGRIFEDAAQLDQTPPTLRNKLERIVAPLSRVASKESWDLLPEVRAAVEMIEEARAAGVKNLDDLVAQQGLFGEGHEYGADADERAVAAEVGVRLMRPDGYKELHLTPTEARSLAAHYVRTLRREYGSAKPAEIAREVFESFNRRSQPSRTESQAVANRAPERQGAGATGGAQPDLSGYRPGEQVPEVGNARERGEEAGAVETVPENQLERKAGERGSLTLVPAQVRKTLSSVGSPQAQQSQEIAARNTAIETLRSALQDETVPQFGEKVRTFVTGARDVSIAQGNQVREQGRRIVKDHIQQEALTLMRDFKNRPGEMQQFLAGTHAAYRQLTPEQRVQALTKINSLRPVIEQALNPTPEMQTVDKILTDLFERNLAEGRELGFLDSTISNEEYITHLLQPSELKPKPGILNRMSRGRLGPRNFKFAKQRSYPTMLHAIVGGAQVRTLNALDALSVYSEKYGTTRAYHMLLKVLKKSAVGKWGTFSAQKAGKIPSDWVELSPQSNIFRNEIAFMNKEGEPDVAHQTLFVPPAVAEAMRPILDPDYLSRIPGFQKGRMYQAYIKAVSLGLSVFHLRAMEMSGLGNEGLNKLVASQLDSMKSQEFRDAEKSWLRAGLTTPVTGRTIEVYKSLQPSSLPTPIDRIRSIPVIKQIDKASSAISHLTFEIVQRKLKVTDASLKYAAWIAKNPRATPEEAFEAQRQIAKEINAVYGGLHWENMGVHATALGMARLHFLAPDWTYSNFLNLKYTFQGGPAGNAARMFWLRYTMWALGLTAGLSLILTGKLAKDPTRVNLGKTKDGKDVTDNVFFTGAPGDASTLIHNTIKFGFPVGLAKSIFAKLGPFAKTAADLGTNQNPMGQPIIPRKVKTDIIGRKTAAHEPTFAEKSALGAGELVRGIMPVPFSVATIIKMLRDPKQQYKLGQYVESVITGRQPTVEKTGTR